MMNFWLNALLLLVVLPGHAALLVWLLNRVYAFPLPCRVLHLLRMTHDVLMLGAPPAFVWLAGVHGPRVLLGGSWFDLPVPLLAYTALCAAISLVAIPIDFIRRRSSRISEAQLANHTEVFDVAAFLGRRPVGIGPQQFLTRVPGNEVFEVEYSKKQYALARLPKACDGLSILHLTDLHFVGTIDREFFEVVVERANEMAADIVAVTGDLVDRLEYLDWLPATLGRLEARLGRFFILGNHDWFRGDVDAIRRAVCDMGFVDLAGRWKRIDHAGAPLVLAGTEVPWLGCHPKLAGAPADAFRILLSHTPDNFAWAQSEKYDLMLAGHLHGGQVVLPGWGPVYSPSRYGCRYIAGPYQEGPTLMYVSRGLSGIHPLRIGARPEVTKLVLRAADSCKKGTV